MVSIFTRHTPRIVQDDAIKMIENCSSAMITSLDGCTGTGNWFVILIVCVTAAIVLAVALGAFKDKK